MSTRLAELDAHAKSRGWSLRMGIEPQGPVAHRDPPTRIAWVAVYDKPGKEGEELETVFIPKKKRTSMDDAAALLLELVQRIPTPED